MGRRLPINLTQAELDALLPAAHLAAQTARTKAKRYCTLRDLVMIETGRRAGLRVSEMCKLRVENLDLAGCTLSVIHGKGDKDRNVPISDVLLPILKNWLGDRTSGFVFPGPGGRKLSERTFQLRLAALGQAAGIVKRVRPHRLRHTFATTYLRVPGADLRELQDLLGHADLRTTAIYLAVEVSRLKAKIDLM